MAIDHDLAIIPVLRCLSPDISNVLIIRYNGTVAVDGGGS